MRIWSWGKHQLLWWWSMKHWNSHGRQLCLCRGRVCGSRVNPHPTTLPLPRSLHMGWCVQWIFFPWNPQGEVCTWIQERQEGERIMWDDIISVSTLDYFEHLGRGWVSVHFFWEILCLSISGAFFLLPPNLAVSCPVAPKSCKETACLWRVSWRQQAGQYPHIETWSTLLLLPMSAEAIPQTI